MKAQELSDKISCEYLNPSYDINIQRVFILKNGRIAVYDKDLTHVHFLEELLSGAIFEVE